MVTCDAGISNRGAMRSSSTVILPRGDEVAAGAGAAFELVLAENLRSQTLRRATGRLTAHRSTWPPMRPNICTLRWFPKSEQLPDSNATETIFIRGSPTAIADLARDPGTPGNTAIQYHVVVL